MGNPLLFVPFFAVLCQTGICSGGLYTRSQSVNLTGPGQSSGSPGHCAWLCEMDDTCSQAEFHAQEEGGSCTMTSAKLPMYLGFPDPDADPASQPDGTVVVGDGMLLSRQGDSGASKPRSCADVIGANPSAPSGVYLIWPDSLTESRVWCDMDTDGGGWTMVYSYKTLFEALENNTNAVTPYPTWPVDRTDLTPPSTTPPSDLHEYGALDFPLWQHVGEEFMIKSNINNWIACVNETGSLTRWVEGSVSCRMIKSITTTCPDLVVGQFNVRLFTTGPVVNNYGSNGWMYAFIGSKVDNWPVHDPCAGFSASNHITGVWPKGQIWVR